MSLAGGALLGALLGGLFLAGATELACAAELAGAAKVTLAFGSGVGLLLTAVACCWAAASSVLIRGFVSGASTFCSGAMPSDLAYGFAASSSCLDVSKFVSCLTRPRPGSVFKALAPLGVAATFGTGTGIPMPAGSAKGHALLGAMICQGLGHAAGTIALGLLEACFAMGVALGGGGFTGATGTTGGTQFSVLTGP